MLTAEEFYLASDVDFQDYDFAGTQEQKAIHLMQAYADYVVEYKRQEQERLNPKK